MNKIIVIGSINQDIILELERFPKVGESLLSNPAIYANGGKGANQALAVARLGESTLFVGKVGHDTFGERMKGDLSSDGVDTTLLKYSTHTSTGLALVMLANGENTIVVSPGANGEVSRADVDEVRPYMKQARLLLIQLEIPLDTVGYAMNLAHHYGMQVILDPGPAQICPPEILRDADFLTPNETEAAKLTGMVISDLQTARQAALELTHYVRQGVVIKMGAFGALAIDMNKDHKQEYYLEAIPVNVRDSTAAGDAFCAAMAVSLLHGASFIEAARLANLVGALTVTRLGAQPSLPTSREVEFFKRQHHIEICLPWES